MITPLGKRIVVKRVVDKQSGTIIIPDIIEQKQSGIVVALGTGAPGFSFTVKVGDKIMIPPHEHYVIAEHEIDGEPHMLMREEHVLAIMDQDKKAA